MTTSDIGSPFANQQPPQTGSSEPVLRIGPEDIAAIQPVGPQTLVPGPTGGGPVLKIDVQSPQNVAAARYGVTLSPPQGGETLFVGVCRHPNSTSQVENYWPLFSSSPRQRQHQIFTFVVEISDQSGNPTDYVPVEVSGQLVSGVLPSDGTPVAVYGTRDPRDRVVRTHKVNNLQTRSGLQVAVQAKDICFVATAVYGDVEAPPVVRLRRFRDRRLLPTRWGRALVRFYYRRSPPLARWIAAHPWWRHVGRAFLDGLVMLLDWLGAT